MKKSFIPVLLCVIIVPFFFINKNSDIDKSSKEFSEFIKKENVRILDVRSVSEFDSFHIEGAINIDVNDSMFLEKCRDRFSKDDVIAVYCYLGGRSKSAANILIKDGFKKVVNLKNGISGWLNEGFSVVN